MKYMILGAGSGIPHPDYNLSSLVIQTQEANFLVDCGEGASKKLLKHGFNGNFIDAVLISHLHPDHISGLFMLLQMLYLEGRTKPLTLFLPERPVAIIDIMHLFYTFEQRFSFALKVHEVKEIELYYSDVTVALTDHLIGYKGYIEAQHYPNQMLSYSFAFTENDRTLLYTADLETFANIEFLLMNSTHIIIDALHPDASLIMSLTKSKAEKIILNHGISELLLNWLNQNPDPRFMLAQEDITSHL
jgi:ribonuclease BN (tRNA processing enzyme)